MINKRKFRFLVLTLMTISPLCSAKSFEQIRAERCPELKSAVELEQQALEISIEEANIAQDKYERVKREQSLGQASYQDVTNQRKILQNIIDEIGSSRNRVDKLLVLTIQICGA